MVTGQAGYLLKGYDSLPGQISKLSVHRTEPIAEPGEPCLQGEHL